MENKLVVNDVHTVFHLNYFDYNFLYLRTPPVYDLLFIFEFVLVQS